MAQKARAREMCPHIAAGCDPSCRRPIGSMHHLLRIGRARAFLLLAAAAPFLCLPGACPGQESLRMSLAGAQAAEARRKAAATLDYYNLKLGPTAWRFSAGLGLEANDNLRGDASNPQSDLIFRPELDAQMRLPLSELNTLNLAVAGGYAFYVQHTEYDRPFINPGSELAFDVYTGDIWVNVHDRFAIEQVGYLDPTVTSVGDYERLDNAAGLAATWDLNKLVARAAYDHVTYVALGANAGQAEGDAEVFAGSAGYLLKPAMRTGLELGASILNYTATETGTGLTDGTELSAGAFYEGQLTEHIQARLNVGYTIFWPDTGSAGDQAQQFSGVYAQAGLTHRLNQYVDYTLSGGRVLNFGFYGGLLDQYFARLDANWHFIRKTNLATSLGYQHGTQLGPGGETFDWFGPALSLNHLLTDKLTGSLGYQYYWRSSDLPGRNYSVNIVTGSFLYRF